MSGQYNARVEVHRSSEGARILRVYPDGVKPTFQAGQYGSLGLVSATDPNQLVRRAYSVSSSMLDLQSGDLVDPIDIDYFEFYINKVAGASSNRERIAPKIFALKDGDRIYCGRKIVGHYTLDKVPTGMDLLMIGTTTGEAANNAIIGEALRKEWTGKIFHIMAGDRSWTSLYADEHAALTEGHPNYRYLMLSSDNYIAELESLISGYCADPDKASEPGGPGFALRPENCRVFLVGDPRMIGAPKKLGGWEYEYPDFGLIRILKKNGFSLRTRFKEGDIFHESYW